MNRPDKKNALTLAMYEAMTAAFEGANADGSVRCVLIAGVPGAFSAGNDLTDFLKAAESTGGLNRPALRFLSALVRCNKPMVAAVSGVAVGVGTTMLFHCDFVVAGSDAYFSTPFVSLGLIPEAASSLLAPRLMGQRRAFEFLVMGHPLNATQAKEFGIANIVVAPEDVDTEGLKAAREIAALLSRSRPRPRPRIPSSKARSIRRRRQSNRPAAKPCRWSSTCATRPRSRARSPRPWRASARSTLSSTTRARFR